MENIYRCNVALNGDVRHVVSKEGVTVPELSMLRTMHNPSSITLIALTGKENYDSDTERDRLGKIYTDIKVQEVFGPYGDLPMDIKKLRIDDGCMEKGEPIGTFPKKVKKKEVKKFVADAEEMIADAEKNEEPEKG